MTLESKLSASVHSFGRSSPPRDGGEMAFSAGRQGVGGWLRLYHRVVAGHLSRYAMHSSVSTYWAQKRGSRKSFCFKRNQKSLLLLLDNKRFGSFDAPIPFFRDRTRDLGMPENLLQSHALPTELRRGCLMMFQAELHTETLFSTNRRLPPRILHWRPFRVTLQEAVLVRYVAVQLRLGPDHSAPS